jgi:hypothetical protein
MGAADGHGLMFSFDILMSWLSSQWICLDMWLGILAVLLIPIIFVFGFDLFILPCVWFGYDLNWI